jgi:hypothetical protein
MRCAPGGAWTSAALVLALAIAGCTDDGEKADGTLPTAPPTSPIATTTVASTPSTIAPTTTVADTTTVAPETTVPAGVGLSPAGPWHLVDSAPGITTPGLVYELMPKLWAFIQLEETETSSYPWTLNDADRPIIEAYLQAQMTYYEAVTSNPINLDLPGWTEFYSGESAEVPVLRERQAQGQVTDLDLGVVMSPQVLGDERTDTYAIVSDCILDGAVSRLPDGSLAPGSSLGVGELAWGARLSLTEGGWKVVQIGPVVGGCDQ